MNSETIIRATDFPRKRTRIPLLFIFLITSSLRVLNALRNFRFLLLRYSSTATLQRYFPLTFPEVNGIH